MSQPKLTSPARSTGSVARRRSRRTLSTASPRSEGSVRLSAVVEKFCNDDFVLTPLKRRSVLPDDTGIEAPRRTSWWKRLDGSSRDVLEALDTNKMTDDLLVEEYEFEVEKDKQNQSVPESSDNESVASIVVPQRRLFNQKKQPQGKFAVIGSRKSLGRTNIEDESIEVAPKTLFNKGPRNKPVFPAALLNSTNKTINKTVEPEPTKQTRPNLFGQAGTKRKNMFADFVVSDSEEDSEVQHKVFGFNKNNNKRMSLGTRARRMPSLTPSMTTEIDIDDWNLLPSSTMIGAQEVSRMSTDDVEQVQEENQDVTRTEENESLNRKSNNRSNKKSAIENDKTLTNEDIRNASNQEVTMNESITNKAHERSKSKLNESVKNKTLQNKSSTRANAENEVIEEVVLEKQQNNAGTKTLITEMNEPSIEDIMAELHGENVEKEKSRQNVQLDRTKENLENYKDTGNYTYSKEKHEKEPSSGEQNLQDASKAVNGANQNEDDDLSEKDKSQDELDQIIQDQKSQNRSKDASIINQDKDLNDKSKMNKVEEEMGQSFEDQVSEEHSNETNQEKDIESENEEEIEASAEERDHSEEVSDTIQNEDMNGMSEMDKSEEEVEPSANDEENQQESNEVTHENQDEEMEDISADDKSEEEVEPSDNGEENQHETTEVSHENEDEEMEDKSEKDKTEEVEQDSQNDSEEESDENQDEEMEKMVWNDNDDENTSDSSKAGIGMESKHNNEVVPNEKGSESGTNRSVDRKDITNKSKNLTNKRDITNKSKNLTNKSHKLVETSVDNDQMEEEVVDETPNNSTHDTTGRNRKKGTFIKSPEAVLQNMTTDNESFRPIGRSTTFRKSKSMYEMMNRPSLAPVQESTLGSEGSRNSSTEGSEWDSHRTTRKTIRQTLGMEYTTRKSLRALVMEQSAKRQTEIYNKNMSNINKTKNKTVLEGNDKNASKINKTKTVLEDANKTATIVKTKNNSVSNDKNASTYNKTKNTTILEDVNKENAAINNTKNKIMLDDVDDQHIRRRTSNRNLSSNQSRISSASVHGTSPDHVPDLLIPKHQISHLKSLHELSNREDSINILENDSGPEISMNASYGQGMSADTAHEGSVEEHEATDIEMNDSPKQMKEIPRNTSIRSRSIRNSDQEILDYEASELDKSEQEIAESDQGNVEQVSMQQSAQDNEKEDSESEESEKEVEAETDHEESEQENEDSQQEIEADSEQEESQQEIAESENEESEQEVESEQESQQEIESEHEAQQEIESEQEESQQEIEPDSDQESENEQENDASQPESDHESDQENREPQRDSEDDDFVSGLNSRYHDNKSGVSRVVFDSRMMSADEIDFEGVSRQTEDDNEGVTQTDNDATEQSVREPELSRNTRISEPSVHEVSMGTKKSLLLMQMQKIAQQNMELKLKIREQVQKSLKPTRSCNIMSPVPKYSIRRITKEPRRPAKKPTRAGVAMENLPKAFLEDLNYKPPKRFHKANAPWITKRLYKFLETKLEPRYDYRARVRAEELVQTIYSFTKLVRRQHVAPPHAVDELKREMARLRVVNTHHEFYHFFHEFMPREVRIKVNPDVVNKIAVPRNVFGEILQSCTAVE